MAERHGHIAALPISDIKKGEDTYWAPEVIEHAGTYHMYLTYVPGIFTDWAHPRDIIHLTSKNLIDWDYQSTLKLSSDRTIDATVIKLPNGTWRMWYNNEKDDKSIYYADSNDLYIWHDRGKAAGQWRGEGPKVFQMEGLLLDVGGHMGRAGSVSFERCSDLDKTEGKSA